MKVLFLDIDGVLNSRTSLRISKISREMVMRLNRIVSEGCCKVVLSSSWRCLGLENVNQMLKDAGFLHTLIGMTPRRAFEARGSEIQEWMDDNSVDKKDVVILDDDTDMLDLNDRLVKTSIETGLTDDDVNEILKLLR